MSNLGEKLCKSSEQKKVVDREVRTGKNRDMNRVVVVHLKKDSMEVWAVENGEKMASAETSWQPDDLVDKLKIIKERFQTSSVRVLIASEIAGTETVLNVLSGAALGAKLPIEMVEPASLEEHEGDDVVALAGKDSDQSAVISDQVGETTPIAVQLGGQVKSRNKWWKWAGIAGGVVLLIGLIVGGVMRSRDAVSEAETIVITPLASVEPSPSPEPVEMAGLSVQILNGSGVTGRAGEIGELMMELGVEEELITTGNASNYDYEGVEVMLKEGVDVRVVEEIRGVLGDEYTVSDPTSPTASLGAGELEYDVVVIVGTKIESE